MGRPLRAVYANTTYISGVQEMSDSDITGLCAQLILEYCVANSTTAYGTFLRIDTAAPSVPNVNRGTVLDTNTGTVGAHPSSNTTITTFNAYQSQLDLSGYTIGSGWPTVRPVHYVSGKIQTMTNADLNGYFIPAIVNAMNSLGAASYYLTASTTNPNALGNPGTWNSVSTLSDTYSPSSGTINVNYYTLWQRTVGDTKTTVRPLKATANGSLQEMSDSEITALYQLVSEYIRTTGIGTYAFAKNLPTPGTWSIRGSYLNTINDLVDTSYVGSYLGYFSSAYTGAYTQAFTGSYAGTYTQAFTGAYAGTYTGAFSGSYTGTYAGTYNSAGHTTYGPTVTYASTAFTGSYAGTYAGTYNQAFTGSYAGTYSGAFTGSYAGTYSGTFTGIYNSPAFSGTFTGAYSGLTTQSSTTSTTYYLWVRTA